MRNTSNFQHEAYEAIKEFILTTDLKPGEKVSKRDLADRLGIGDTPVREAIIRLTKEGLFRVVPQSGTYISKISLKELKEAQFMRDHTETFIISEAADILSTEQMAELERQIKLQEVYIGSKDHLTFFQLDEDFHHQFYLITDKHYIWKWMKLINVSLNRYRYLRLEMEDLSWENIIEEHKMIVDQMKKQNKTQLKAVVSRHLHMIDQELDLVLAAYPDYFEE